MSKKHRFTGDVLPEVPFVAVGDVHGRADLLDRFLASLDGAGTPDFPLVFVGDYVDRGEDSAGVLTRIIHLQRALGEDSVKCLLGNHEQMMLNFLEDPVLHGARWLRYGGLQTLASYNVPIVAQTAPEDEWLATRDVFAEAVGKDTIAWLYARPTLWMTGNVAVVHAGADPERDISEQDDHVLIWGHKDFDEIDRKDEVWVVHGHTIVDNAITQNGRISVDTGAYATGVLSAAIVRNGDVSFVTA